MSGLDLENLSPTQKEILVGIWSICEYLKFARGAGVEDRILAEQAKNIGLAVAQFEREEDKKAVLIRS
jgi:hypothetical protein